MLCYILFHVLPFHPTLIYHILFLVEPIKEDRLVYHQQRFTPDLMTQNAQVHRGRDALVLEERNPDMPGLHGRPTIRSS